MKTINQTILAFFIVVLFSAYTIKLQPLLFLKDKKTVIIKQGGVVNQYKHQYIDTLDAKRIIDLSNMDFEKKNFPVEHLSVTPDYSINIYAGSDRICLLGIWAISDDKYAVNINYLEKNKFFSGYVINKEKFNSLINLKKFNR